MVVKKIHILLRYIKNILFSITRLNKKNNILIPPTILNGGFGDDIMVTSYIDYFKNNNILLLTEKVIFRNDIFQNYNNIKYLSWKENIKWEYYFKLSLLGADNLSGSYGDQEVKDKIKILQKANFFNKKISILGFSLSNTINDSIKKDLNNISKFTVFNLRDPDSYKRAESFLPKKSTKLVTDVAFLCPLIKCENDDYITWIRNQKNEDRIIIAICPNSIHMRKYKDEEYINQYVDFIKQINNSGKYSFVLLYHDLRELNENWNDMLISKELYSILKSYNNVYFTDKIINGVQLKSYLPFVDLTITSRMHLGISGYSLGKPMLGITYENKFSGLQKLFEISPERSLIDYTDLNNLFKIFETFMDDYHKNCKLIQKNLPNILKLSKKNFE